MIYNLVKFTLLSINFFLSVSNGDVNNNSSISNHTSTTKAPFSVIVLCTKSKYFCSGVILDVSWALTSAHCLHDLEGKLTEGDQTVVVVAGTIGLSDAKASIKAEQAQIRLSKKIIIHKDYTWRQKFVNDLALIQMSEAFLPSEWVKVPDLNKTRADTPMVPGPHDHNNEEINIPCSSYSYGKGVGTKGSYRIKQADYMVNKHCHCLEWIRSYKSPVDILRQRNIFICDKNVVNGEILCEGDNGGPLVCDGVLRGLLTNVFHYNNRVDCKLVADHDKMECSDAESYVLFTDLCYFAKWLSDWVPSYPHLDELCNIVIND